MKLSEAISLGHTLVGETHHQFFNFDYEKPCGCAIFSAFAAVEEVSHERVKEVRSRLIKAKVTPFVAWLQETWPWTARPVSEFPGFATIYHPAFFSLAEAISNEHYDGRPRMDIAEAIAKIEPEEDAVQETCPASEEVPVCR